MIYSEGCRESESSDLRVANCKTQTCITTIVTVLIILKTSYRKSDKIGSILEQILVYLEGCLKSECSDLRVVNCKTQTCITIIVTVLIILKTSHRKSDKIGNIPEQIPIFPEANLKSESLDMRVVNCKTQICITTIVTILIILKTSHIKSGKIGNIPKQMLIYSEACRESECSDL